MFKKKPLRLWVCKTTHCSEVYFCAFNEKDDSVIRKDKDIKLFAGTLRDHLHKYYPETCTNITCTPKFDFIKNGWNNPTLCEALSPEEKIIFFKNFENRTGGGAAN